MSGLIAGAQLTKVVFAPFLIGLVLDVSYLLMNMTAEHYCRAWDMDSNVNLRNPFARLPRAKASETLINLRKLH